MQTQDTDKVSAQAVPPLAGPRKRRTWVAGVGAFFIVLLVIGASIVVFSALGQRHSTTQIPPARQWKQVKQGYLFLSIEAAPSEPAVLYACATTSTVASNQVTPATVTILRSSDLGDHWQNTGTGGLSGDTCELAVNPGNSNDIYAVSTSNAVQLTTTLKHSTDGGQTWETIVPALRMPHSSTTIPWFVQQLRVEGNNLFGIQWLVPRPTLPPTPTIPYPGPIVRSLPRLVTSADGGHTWTIIDNQFAAAMLGSQHFVLDSTRPGTIYELVGKPWFPVESTVPEDPLPGFAIDESLYKTTDNGANWRLLLHALPFGTQLQIASLNPQIIYVGGTLGPLPLASQPGGPAQGGIAPYSNGSFHLQVSRDGGASWKQAATSPGQASIQNWFVSADGHVYTSPTMTFSEPGGQGTAVSGTAIPPVFPTAVSGTPRAGGTLPAGGTPLSGWVNSVPPSYPATQTPSTFILSYDPAGDSWSQVTAPPTNGQVLQVTPAGTNSGAALWFMGVPDNQFALYRYVV